MAEHESALLTSQSSLDDHVDTYLRHKRMFGRSGYKAADVIRAAGGRWDHDKRKWFAPNRDALIARTPSAPPTTQSAPRRTQPSAPPASPNPRVRSKWRLT